MLLDMYFGTIVSGRDVFMGGVRYENISLPDRGLLVARGDVDVKLKNAALAQLAIRAQNVSINLTNDLLIRGVTTPFLTLGGSVSQLTNLQQLSKQLGLANGSAFNEQGASISPPAGLTQLTLPSSSPSGNSSRKVYKCRKVVAAEDSAEVDCTVPLVKTPDIAVKG
jgi:hypothetical protein